MTERFDILMVVSHLGAGGTQRVVCALANSWSRAGYRVGIVSRQPGGESAFPLDATVKQLCLPDRLSSRRLLYVITAFKVVRWALLFRALVKRSGCPVVVSFIRSTNVCVVLACLGLRNTQVIVSERNDPERQDLGRSAPFWNWLSRQLYRHADVVTANNRGALSAMATYVPREKLVFAPNPLSVPATQDAIALQGPTILAVGRLVPQKAYDTLLFAFAKVAAAEPAWQLCVLGGGPLRTELEARTMRLELDRQVLWAGHVSDPFPYYKGADIFVMSSRYEGTPNALLEAMSCGLSVVVTDASPGPLELVEDGVTGLVVPVDDDAALASAVLRLIRDPDLRQRLGGQARARVVEFQPERAIAVWNSIVGLAKDPASTSLQSV